MDGVGVVFEIDGDGAFFGLDEKSVFGVGDVTHGSSDFGVTDGEVSQFFGEIIISHQFGCGFDLVTNLNFRFSESATRSAREFGGSVIVNGVKRSRTNFFLS